MKTSPRLLIFFTLFAFCFFSPLVSPFFLAKSFSSSVESLDGIAWSLLQSLLSSALTLVFGFLCGWSLSSRRVSSQGMCLMRDFLLLLPSFLPALVGMVSVLTLLSFFPFGFGGVVLMNVLLEMGLATFLFARIIREKRRQYVELFLLYPKSVWREQKVMLPLLGKDFFLLFVVFFLHYLMSLSIPMIMSGGQFVSVEYKMYTLLKNSLAWDQVVPLYVFQGLWVLPLVLFLPWTPSQRESEAHLESIHRPSPWNQFYILALIPSLLLLWSLLVAGEIDVFWTVPGAFYVNTLLMGFVGAGGTFLALLLVAYFYQQPSLRKILRVWTVPSFSVLSFACFSLDVVRGGIFGAITMMIFLFVPALAKMGLYQRMEDLTDLLVQAALLGATPEKTFRKLVLPQILPTISRLSGFASLWMMGDFAITRLFFSKDQTFSLAMQSLMDQYRWSTALSLAWPLLACCLFVFLFFGSLAYVADQKLN